MSEMSSTYIDNYFLSEIGDLEDVFLGVEIHHKIFIERILYDDYNSTEEFSRTKNKEFRNSDDYENLGIIASKINYNEIDYDSWHNHLHLYSQEYALQDEINYFFMLLDEYLTSKIDINAKMLIINKITDKIKYCLNKFNTEIDTFVSNKHQFLLVEIFTNIYGDYLERIEANKYKTFLKSPEKSIHQNDESLNEIFYPDRVSDFPDLEERLKDFKIIDDELKFIDKYGNKTKFIKFCLILEERGYLKGNNKMKKIFNFFEKRYDTKFGDQTKPNKYTKLDLKGEFSFITNHNNG